MQEYENLSEKEKHEFDEATEKRNEAYYSFCDKIVTLSTGFLALTVTFKSSFVKTDATLPTLLYLSDIGSPIKGRPGFGFVFVASSSQNR